MRRLIALLVLVAALLLPATAALAADDFLPPKPAQMVTWTKPPLYDRYPVWHYTYGGTQTTFEQLSQVYYLINLMQVGKAWLVKFAIRSVEYALYFDPLGSLMQKAGASLAPVKALLWDDGAGWLLKGGLAAAAAAALYYWVIAGRREKAWRVLAAAAALLIGSLVVLTAAPTFLVNASGVARGLGQELLKGVAARAAPAMTEGTPTERLMRSAGEGAWTALVLDPWIEGEFTAGSALKDAYKEPDVEGGKWLALTPKQRLDKYRAEYTIQLQDFHQYDAGYAADYMPRRFLLVTGSLALALVWSGGMLLVAGGVLYYQLLLVAVLALLPVWLVLALLHPAGMRVARGALLKVMGALVAQVVLLTVLAVALAVSGPLLQVAEPLGWFGQGLLAALFVAILARYRFAWLRWGRERDGQAEGGAFRQAGGWIERTILRRNATSHTTREVVREGGLTAGQVLPQFREELQIARREARDEPAAVARPTLELADELKRLRLRFHDTAGAAATPVEILRSDVAVRSADGARKVVGGLETTPTPAVRPRAELGQTMQQYRKR